MMNFHAQHLLRSVILLAFAGFLFKLHLTGDIGKYVSPHMVTYSQVAAVLFVLLFFVQIKRIWNGNPSGEEEHGHDHAHEQGLLCDHDHGLSGRFGTKVVLVYVIMSVPLLTGFFMPVKTLDSSIAANKGVQFVSSKARLSAEQTDNRSDDDTIVINEGSAEIEKKETIDLTEEDVETTSDSTADISDTDGSNEVDAGATANGSSSEANESDGGLPPLEDIYADSIRDLQAMSTIRFSDKDYVEYADTISLFPDKFKGKPIEIIGFVFKEEGMAENELVVARFTVTCCVADAGVIGFFARIDEASALKEDTWIKVKGTLDVTTYNDYALPMINVSAWEKVEEPDDPYVYPNFEAYAE